MSRLKNPTLKAVHTLNTRPNSAGYTDKWQEAGIYLKKEAIEHAKSCDELTLVPINNTDYKININKEINRLKTLLDFETAL